MAGYGHLYWTAHGTMGGAWQGESAQIGLRVMLRTLGDSSGPIVPVVDRGPVELVSTLRDTTDFNITQTFRANVPGVPLASWEEVVDDMADDWLTFLGKVRTQQSTLFTWRSIKVAPIEAGTGKFLAPATVYSLKSAIAGSVATAMPPQTSVCASLRAPILGRRGRGRMYIPSLKQGMADSAGKVASAERSTLANSLKTLVKELEDSPGTDLFQTRVCIMSAASTTAVLPAEVRVGDQFDVQRRRETDVVETYTTLSL